MVEHFAVFENVSNSLKYLYFNSVKPGEANIPEIYGFRKLQENQDHNQKTKRLNTKIALFEDFNVFQTL